MNKVIRFLKWPAVIAGIFTLILSLIFYFFQTNFGREKLLSILNRPLAESSIQIKIKNSRGIIPFSFKADQLEVTDKDGVFLDLRDITFRLSASSLLKGRLHVKELSVDSVMFNALPQVKKKEVSAQKEAGFIPEKFFRLGISRLMVNHLQIPESLFGESMDFRIMSSLSVDSRIKQSHVDINIVRIDKPGSSMFFKTMVRGTQPYLTMTGGIDDKDGLIAGLLGSKGETKLSLTGEGELTDWSGTLKTKVENIASLESEIGLKLYKNPELKLAGAIEFVKGFMPENAEKIIGLQNSFLIEARLKEKRNLEFDRLELKTETALISLTGLIGLKDLSTKGSYDIILNDLATPSEILKKEITGTARLKGEFRGTPLEPEISSNINIKDLKTDSFQTGNLAAKMNLVMKKNPGSNLPFFNIIFNGVFNDTEIKKDSIDFSEEKIILNLEAEGPVQDNILVKKIEINSRDAALSGSGTFNRLHKTVTAKGLIDIKSIDTYRSLSGIDIKGRNILDLNIFADISNSIFKTDFKGSLSIIPDKNRSFASFTGQNIKYSGELESKEFKSIHFNNINILSETGNLAGSGSYYFSSRSINAILSIKIPQLEKLSSLTGHNLNGSGQLYAEIKGPMDRIELKTKTSVQNLSVNNREIDNLTAAVNATGKPMDNEGSLSITLDKSGYIIKGTSFFKMHNNILDLRKIELRGSGIILQGDFTTQIDRPLLLDGNLKLVCEDLTGPSSFFEENVSGSLSIEGAVHKGGTDIDIGMNMMGTDLNSRFINTEKVDIKSRITGSLDSPLIDSNVLLKNVKQDNLVFDSIDAEVNGTVNNADFRIKGNGRSAHEFKVDLGGTYRRNETNQVLSVNNLQADYESMPLNLMRPFNLIRSDNTIELGNIELNFHRGIIKSSGSLVNDQINFSLEYQDLPLSSLSLFGIPNIKGFYSGNLSIGGSLSEPVIKNKIDVDFQWALSDKNDEPSQVKATLNTTFNSGNLRTDVSINGTESGEFTGSLDIPVKFTIMPFSYSFVRTGQIKGYLSGLTEISNITPLMELPDHRISGGLDMNFTVSGTVASPKISGNANIKNGGYDNIRTGTILREIDMEISAEPPKIEISKITAVDGLGGEITGQGWIEATPETRFPYKLVLDLKGFTLAQNDTISVTAGGQSTLSGTMSGHKLNGGIEINRAEVNIPDKLPPEITEVDVTEINVEGTPVEYEPEKTKKKESASLNLDLSVTSSGRVFVNGRGLTSEWKGNLNIKGSTDSPVITGKLSIVRGYYNFLGKRLQLTRGNIYFDGKVPVSPRIDITGETSSQDIKVYLTIAGDVGNPELKLESDPYLPSDEILSRLLFGRSVSQITPLQAIQLANAVNTFMKGGKGFNILDRTRKLLKVDQLEIRQSEDNVSDSTISAGKYLKDNIYLEVEKGLESDSGSASVKWELTPNITVETKTNVNEETETGISWKKDY